jgi:hypothetical protein
MANLTTLSNSEIFRFAHSSAKKMTAKLGGHYSANFTCALRAIYGDIKTAKSIAAASKANPTKALKNDVIARPDRYTRWEIEFVMSVANQAERRALSAKQQAIVNRLVAAL